MDAPVVICANCFEESAPKAVYCSNCGQKLHIHKLNAAYLFHEAIHFVTHADKGIFYLLKMMLIRPGQVIQEYVAGRRKKYFSPLSFFLIVVGLFVFVHSTLKPMGSGSDMSALKNEVAQIPNKEMRERRLNKIHRTETAINFISTKSNYVTMAITPIIAFVFFLFYSRRKYNYTEHLVANLYIAAMNALFFIFIITPYLLVTQGKPIYLVGIFVFLSWEAIYRAIAYYGFMGKKGIMPFFYALFISLLIVIGWYFFSRGLIQLYIEHGV